MSGRVTTALLASLAVFVLGDPCSALTQEPPAQPTPPAASEAVEPVVGQLEHSGWMLSGQRGRHYVFGGLAVADYAGEDRRQIVTLQQEEPSLLPKPDDKFLYFRELGSGRRWAIGRYPLEDDSYLVYLQAEPASENGKGRLQARWQLFHRARLIWPERQTGAAGNPQVSASPLKTPGNCAGQTNGF